MQDYEKRQEGQLAQEVKRLHQRLKEIQAKGFLYTEKDLIIQDRLEYAESIIATVREPLIVLDYELKVVSASQSFYNVFKTKPEETLRRFIYDLGERQWDIPDLRKLLNEILPRHKSINNFQVEYPSLKLGKRIMLVNAEWIPREAVRPQLILLAIEDITESKKQEMEVLALKKQIEFILGATKTGLDIIDSDYNIRFVDPEWTKVYGGDPAGKKCYEYFMGASKVCPGCGLVKALETKKIVVKEEILVKEGNRPIQVTSIPYQDENGTWLVAEVNVDISERKKLEESLKNSSKELEMRVKVRTAELSKVNEDLQKEISQRRQIEEELEARMRDLERFSKFAVDRELKMEELERKVKELEEKVKTE
ncbi:MAG: PAS domain-containing protein [Candidatus Omnitrophota bacterium]|jgi:PAS domain-containing protein